MSPSISCGFSLRLRNKPSVFWATSATPTTPWPASSGWSQQPGETGGTDGSRRSGSLGDGPPTKGACDTRRGLRSSSPGVRLWAQASLAGVGARAALDLARAPVHRPRVGVRHPRCDDRTRCRASLRAEHHDGDVEQRIRQTGRDGGHGAGFPVAAHAGPGSPLRLDPGDASCRSRSGVLWKRRFQRCDEATMGG